MKHKLFLSSLNLLWYKWLTDVTIPSVPARKIRANLKATNRFRSHPAFLLRVVLALPIVSTPGHASPACPKSAPTSPTNLGSSQCCQRGIFFAAFFCFGLPGQRPVLRLWCCHPSCPASRLLLPKKLPGCFCLAACVLRKTTWGNILRDCWVKKNYVWRIQSMWDH